MCSRTPMFIVSSVVMLDGLALFFARGIELSGSGMQSPESFVIWDSVQCAACVGLLVLTMCYTTVCYKMQPKFSGTYVGFAILGTLTSAVTLQLSLIQYMRYRDRLYAADFADQCPVGDMYCQAYNGSLSASEWRAFCAIDMALFVVMAWAFVGVIMTEKQVGPASYRQLIESEENAEAMNGLELTKRGRRPTRK